MENEVYYDEMLNGINDIKSLLLVLCVLVSVFIIYQLFHNSLKRR